MHRSRETGLLSFGVSFVFLLSSKGVSVGIKLLLVRFEGIDGFDKSGFFACHDHVNGVEVFFTAKASGQVGFWICGCLKFTTKGTEKAEMALADFGRYLQSLLYQGIDGYVITQFEQLVLGKAFHVSSLPGCLSGSWLYGLNVGFACNAVIKLHIPMGKQIESSFAITIKC